MCCAGCGTATTGQEKDDFKTFRKPIAKRRKQNAVMDETWSTQRSIKADKTKVQLAQQRERAMQDQRQRDCNKKTALSSGQDLHIRQYTRGKALTVEYRALGCSSDMASRFRWKSVETASLALQGMMMSEG